MRHPLIKCIKYLYPNASLLHDITVRLDAAGAPQLIFWNEEKLGPQPSIESILSNEAAAEAAEQLAICHAKRRAEYPSMADYLDGIVKGDQAQIQKYIEDCLAVKAKYPKP